MKSIRLTIVSFCLIASNDVVGQAPCLTGGRIQTAIVSKPVNPQHSFVGVCDQVKLSWQGNAHQIYILSCSYMDHATGAVTEYKVNPVITCDNDFNCSAMLPIKPGNSITWNIQATAVIDGRTFYSYPLRGEHPGCTESDLVSSKPDVKPLVTQRTAKTENVAVTPSLGLYPNPVTGELTLKWTDEYDGPARITITDASGRTVKLLDIQKKLPDYLDRITVSSLKPGLYFMQIKTQNGKVVSKRFVKN